MRSAALQHADRRYRAYQLATRRTSTGSHLRSCSDRLREQRRILELTKEVLREAIAEAAGGDVLGRLQGKRAAAESALPPDEGRIKAHWRAIEVYRQGWEHVANLLNEG